MPTPFTIAVDFDQTIATGPFPECGSFVPGALEYLIMFQQRGARLILWTMRSDGRECYNDELRRHPLAAAVKFCKEGGLEFWAHNGNPEQGEWSSSPKAYAHLYIDDAAIGVPLMVLARDPDKPARAVVDWLRVGPAVLKLIDEYNAKHRE